jgi:copper homeostasis protein
MLRHATNFMAKPQKVFLEICVDSVESAVAAQAGGADRVELCANLNEDGTTPSAGMIAGARKNLSIGLQVLIRPRSGDFCYSTLEFEAMKKDIAVAGELGADGVVIGMLNSDRTIEVRRTHKLVQLARPLQVTFHRAFDVVVDPLPALETLIELGVDRILTSGQAKTAMEGLARLTQLAKRADGRISIMPASGINAQNIRWILEVTGVHEIHVGSAVAAMQKNSAAEFFAATQRMVDPGKVAELRQQLRSSPGSKNFT